jgi:Putative restriction endonuclease
MAVPDLATVAEAELADLERLWQSLDLPGHRVELVDGQIVVSPSPSRRHAHAVTELIDQLIEAKRRGWQRDTNLTVHMSGTRERLIPDLIVAPADAPGFGDDEVLSTGVLLVAEVVSPSSRRHDRETKNRAYALRHRPQGLPGSRRTQRRPAGSVGSSATGPRGRARTRRPRRPTRSASRTCVRSPQSCSGISSSRRGARGDLPPSYSRRASQHPQLLAAFARPELSSLTREVIMG